ncbi:sensor histidine kinase [Streptococcus sanguinis]|uniref:sensor histidine kinase n=1 Tax=Streptococcus sanguinis TaxID=1305 RepID=UPI002283E5D0|nr:sensor histidine kinase [Streptococcus sanguinis]MCY7028939.1 ATP-binding protein [Streptococcus sanguinis]
MQTITGKIRPSSRHLFTIGEDLIQDKFAAIMELVKNSYDADATEVTLVIRRRGDKSISVVIEDNGVGMSLEDIQTKWLVPSTANKLNNRISQHGRIMQGRKGIGRYAANILGDDLLLSTVTSQGESTEIYVDWSEFDKYEYLDEIDIAIETSKSSKESGTILATSHKLHKNKEGEKDEKDWSREDIDKLIFELKKLIPPYQARNDDNFNICIKTQNFDEDIDLIISPFPFFEIYDYRIHGEVKETGEAILYYENQRKSSEIETIIESLSPTKCGKIKLDIRVYDRDKTAIESLIGRGLKDEQTGKYLTNLQTRQLLNDFNGIGVYRNGFRIRPLGDPENDWLELNKRRVQTPSLRIGSNQTIGYVQIESEEISDLHEQSARDGLKKTDSYYGLISITQEVLSLLEQRRFIYRRKIDSKIKNKSVNNKLSSVSDYTSLSNDLRNILQNFGLEKSSIEEVNHLVLKEENKKQKIVDELSKAIAVYQGQATLGKIINVVMHEGRRPLHYFRTQIPNFEKWLELYLADGDDESLNEMKEITEGVNRNSSVLVDLFNRLDPLATRKRDKAKVFSLINTIKNTFKIFETVLEKEKIEIKISPSMGVDFYGWPQDIATIFANLIDNSIYWMKDCTIPKIISVDILENKSELIIDYFDTGKGIKKELIEEESIFDPEFTTKNEGSGLGLAISGEAAERNKLSLIALEHSGGAHFRLSYNKGNLEKEENLEDDENI